jgi:predicted GNAT family N-acyltransferase
VTPYYFEPLGAHHDRAAFDCGVEPLNRYIREQAGQDVRREAARVWIMVETGNPSKIVGYYTLCATSVILTSVPDDVKKRLPRYPDVPAFLIGRLARGLTYPSTGRILLSDALQRCVRLSGDAAAALIVVDAKDAKAAQFYARFGFQVLTQQRLFLPMATACAMAVSS